MRRIDMRDPDNTDGQAGFTLIETMIAIVVLVFGLIGVTNLFIVAASSNATANQVTAAATVASEQLDALRTAPFTLLVAGGTVGSTCPTCGNDDPYTPPVGEPGCPGKPNNHSCTQLVPGVATVQVSWSVVATGPNTLGITVEALPLTGLARGWSRVRLTTIRTCTAPAPQVGAAPCPDILAP